MADNWNDGDDYEAYMGRWSRRVAPHFLAWLEPAAGGDWMDLGCGTGALAQAVLDHAGPASVVGVEPAEPFRRQAAARVRDGRARFVAGDGAALPLPDDSLDYAVSALVLNFVPDSAGVLAEQRRVLRPGGTMAGYVWDYAGHAQLVRRFWDAAADAGLDGVEAADEGRRFPLCRPGPLADAVAAAGFGAVAVTALDVTTAFASFDACWAPFLAGVGPAPAFAMAQDAAGRARLREAFAARLPADPEGRILLAARAWAVRGQA